MSVINFPVFSFFLCAIYQGKERNKRILFYFFSVPVSGSQHKNKVYYDKFLIK